MSTTSTASIFASPTGSSGTVSNPTYLSPEDEANLLCTDHVVVRFGGGRYGIAAPDVAEVCAVPVLTRVPGAPEWMTGIGNWRGHVLPVVDIRPLLGISITPLPSSARVVVVTVDDLEVGLIAEAVTGLVAVPDDCEPPPLSVSAGTADLLRGVAEGGVAGPIGVLSTPAIIALSHRLRRSQH